MASSNVHTSTAFDIIQEFGPNVLNIKTLKALDDVLRCRICFEYFTNCMITKCSHNYCSVCIRRYMNYKSQCPTCFQEATEPELRNNRLIDEILRIYKKIRETLQMPLENINKSFPEQTISKSVIKDNLHELQKGETSTENTIKDQNEISTSDEVSCPVCYTAVPNSRINIHLDTCLKQSEEKSQRKFLPKLVYHLLTDKEIKKKLKEHGLNATGNRQVLIRRHKNFITLFNANCDSLNPKPVSDILLEIEQQELEERLNASQKSTQVNKKSDPSVIEKEHESYVQEHKSQFNALMEDVQQRALAEMHIKKEFGDIGVTSNITDESGNLIGKATLLVGNPSNLEPVIIKTEPSESSFENPVVIKQELTESLLQDMYIRHNEEDIVNVNSAISHNEQDTGMEYMDTGYNKPRLSFRVKKDFHLVKIKEEPKFLLDSTTNQDFKAGSPPSIDNFETSKTSINKFPKKKNARRLSTEDKYTQRKK